MFARYSAILSMCLCVLVPESAGAAATKVLASSGDAFVSLTADNGRSWSIGNAGIELTLAVDSAGLQVRSVVNPTSGTNWIRVPKNDTTLSVGGRTSGLGGPNSPFAFSSADTASDGTSVTLMLYFTSSSLGVRATRTYTCYDGAPIVETWTTLIATGSTSRTVADLNAWTLPITGNDVQWTTGLDPTLMGSGAEPFTAQEHQVGSGETFVLGATGRSTESAMPYFVVQSAGEQFFGGLEWSGAWRLSMAGVAAGGMDVSLGLGTMSTVLAPGASLEMPHGFFGVSTGLRTEPGVAIRAFAETGLRGGRAFQPLVTVNTWFEHGTTIDQDSMHAEIDASASLGAELFVLDAGYYPGAGAHGASDFTSGLGTWTYDPDRFPDGLAAMAQYAHDRGLKFGLWVEPERVALATVGRPGLARSSFLATQGGRYDPNRTNDLADSAQICLGSAAARAWVLDRLTALIDAVQPDYLKWDNNFWINCNAPGHDHGASDGNFAHVRGLYSMLAALRQRYPSLVIENCSGGGHRLDFGMLRYTDVGWMDDRTSPATTVRHNLEGLVAILPPSYLFSFVLDSDAGPDGRLDLPLMFRSRMPGVLGLGFSPAAANEDLTQAALSEIATYKTLRDIQSAARGVALLPQLQSAAPPDWDSVEEVSATTGDAVIYAFQVSTLARTTVQPVGLLPDWTYQVVSADAGAIATGTGADLMAEGIEINASPASSAHLLILRAVSQATDATGGTK